MARVSAFEGLVWITESREIACGMAEPLASSLSRSSSGLSVALRHRGPPRTGHRRRLTNRCPNTSEAVWSRRLVACYVPCRPSHTGNGANPKNLWPEPRSQSNHSDPLETALKRKVCVGKLALAAARQQILKYKRAHG